MSKPSIEDETSLLDDASSALEYMLDYAKKKGLGSEDCCCPECVQYHFACDVLARLKIKSGE
jgi:hypothetical protein